MVNKPQNSEPSGAFDVTKVIQTNAANNIAGSLTTIAQEGSFGVVDNSDRSMLYLYPSYQLRGEPAGARTISRPASSCIRSCATRPSRDIAPLEFYFRPPGTTGAADVLFERDTFRTNGGGTHGRTTRRTSTSTAATSRIAGSRAATCRSRPASASIRTASTRKDRRAGARHRVLPAGFPTVTADKEFGQTTFAPNFGVAWDIGRVGRVPRHRRPLLRVARSGRRRRHVAPAVRRRHRRARASARERLRRSSTSPAGRVPARRQLRPREQEDLHQRVQRRLGKAAAARELRRRHVPPEAHLGFPGQPTTRTSSAIRSRARCSAGRSRITTRCFAPTRRTTRIQQFRSMQLLYTKNFAQAVGHERELLVRHAPVDVSGVQSDPRHAAVPRLHRGRADQRLGDAASPGARLVVRAPAIRRDAVRASTPSRRVRAPTC